MQPAESAAGEVVIYHTADLHGRLSSAAARRLAELREKRPNALLLDAGDAVTAGNLGFRLGGEPILRRMAEIGYGAMAMGNRESHPWRFFLERKLRDASFPVLAANLRARRGRAARMVQGHVILESGGRRVGVFGLAPRVTPPESFWARFTDYVFDEPVAAAQQAAAELRGRTDLVVCLSHCGAETDRQLAALPGISLVLGGHSHRAFVSRLPGQALIVHPGPHGQHVSETRLAGRGNARSALLPLSEGT